LCAVSICVVFYVCVDTMLQKLFSMIIHCCTAVEAGL